MWLQSAACHMENPSGRFCFIQPAVLHRAGDTPTSVRNTLKNLRTVGVADELDARALDQLLDGAAHAQRAADLTEAHVELGFEGADDALR